MFHDIDLTLTFATEAEASRFASAVELSLSNELALGPLRFTFERKYFPEQNSRDLTIFGARAPTRGTSTATAPKRSLPMRAPEFHLQGTRLHALPNQPRASVSFFTFPFINFTRDLRAASENNNEPRVNRVYSREYSKFSFLNVVGRFAIPLLGNEVPVPHGD